MKQNIILTGFMGTGKTTVGKLLAETMKREFVDTDEMIVVQNGRSIQTIFRELGADAFRQMETAVALQLSQRENLIISTGGRLMLDLQNADALMENGIVFCLAATAETIYARVMADGEKRPLLNVPDPLARIQFLLDERAADYGRFPQINVNNKKPTTIAYEIEREIESVEIEK